MRTLSEIDRLRRWKAEVIKVLAAWDEVHRALGSPARPGQSIAAASKAEVERLRSENERLRVVLADVPTGAEVRAHVERWEALPEGERPRYPIERWLPYVQRWEGRIPQGLTVAVHRIPDDDTPQPGLRLVPLTGARRDPV